jgi:DNA mismatch repair protein MutS
MALIKEYFKLTQEYQKDYGENTILLMLVGSFFEVYGVLDKKTNTIIKSKIVDFGKICDLNIVNKNSSVEEEEDDDDELELNIKEKGKTNKKKYVKKDNILDNILDNKKLLDNEKEKLPVVMAGFKDIMIEKYIKKIQEAGFTVVVYLQDESGKNTTRSLHGIYSPGTYFSNDSQQLTNNILCIWVDYIHSSIFNKEKQVVVGMANLDIFTGKTSMFQFQEKYRNNPTTYDELERFVSIYKPSEVVFISNLVEKEMEDILNFINISCKAIHKIHISDHLPNQEKNKFYEKAKNCEKQIYQKEIIHKFYKDTEKDKDTEIFFQHFYEHHIASQAFCFLLDFAYQHNPSLLQKISEPVFENCSDRLILANHSLKQLNIIDDHHYTGKYSSVIKLLNICLTPMGKRKFTDLFLNPSINTSYLQREYDITEYIINIENDFLHSSSQKYNEIKEFLSFIKDISKFGRQLYLKKISPKFIYQIYENIKITLKMYDIFYQDKTIMKYLSFFIKDVNRIKDIGNEVLLFIQSHMNLELAKEIDCIQNFDTNFIQLGVDQKLDENSECILESWDQLNAIRKYLNQCIDNVENKKSCKSSSSKYENAKQNVTEYIKIHETEKNNISFICTSRRCKLLESVLPKVTSSITISYISSFSQKQKTLEFIIGKSIFEFSKQSSSNNFISNEIIDKLCKNITTIKLLQKENITKVFHNILEKMESYQSHLESVIEFITYVDVIYAKSQIAQKYNYCKPIMDLEAEKSFVQVENLRHCLIEHLQTNEIYVTNDISLGFDNGNRGDVNGVLLYGTNAVGKTSFIRALGISIVMAQSGLFVPATKFLFKPYHYLFTRIIGNDNIFKGLSTFAVEMSELRTILRLADKNSLILGDELCSGTENSSAISIFVAGIQNLYEKKSSFIFATHLHEINDYEEIRNLKTVVLKHMAVVYDKERDLLVYDRKLKDGPGNNMYGLEVCKSLGLPTEFLERAYEIRMKYNKDANTNSILSLKTSHFNSQKIVNVCESCGENLGKEVHHLQHQKEADENGIIKKNGSTFHKNNLANLISLCEDCHDKIHKNKKQHKKSKTTDGKYVLRET